MNIKEPEPVSKNHHSRCLTWEQAGIVYESYAYAPGPAGSCARHTHSEYQLCLSLDFPGQYDYRGARMAVPAASLSVIHPGEPHRASDPHDREVWSHYRMLYISPDVLRETLDLAPQAEPFFADALSMDVRLLALFEKVHVAAENKAPRLAQEQFLLDFVTTMTSAMPSGMRRRPARKNRHALPRMTAVRDYLLDHLSENLSIKDLAERVDLHPSYVCRAFAKTYGLPPHEFQLAARLDRAKRLLREGHAPGAVADMLGFADAAHFNRRFRAVVGVTPGRYRLPE